MRAKNIYKILLLLLLFLTVSCTNSFAAKIPDEVRTYINKTVPGTDIRFDGVIILPDNTVYLPLYPSLFSDIKKLEVKESYPAKQELNQKPDVIIFNNDFVLMKVLSDSEGHKTVLKLQTPPLQIRTGLLPQDMLVPSGLRIPENIKGIIGNLKIDTKNEDLIKNVNKESYEEFIYGSENIINPEAIPQLRGKTVFITTNYSKNIQVLDFGKVAPNYSLSQKSIPIDIAPVNNGKFLMVTSYERPFVDIISVADSRFIKQINLGSFPDEIVIDNDKAYITSPKASMIYVIDLSSMTLIQKIKINGFCEKLLLTDDKIFYIDKLKNEIWSIETKNGYKLKSIGTFPNISSIAFKNNQLYLASRTKSRIAIVDYNTLGLVAEFTTVNKPTSLLLHKNTLYVLGAQNNKVQKINIDNGKIIDTISLDNNGFSTRINRIENTDLAVITDVKLNKYSILDLDKGKIIKTYTTTVPLNNVIITNKVELFD